MSQLTHYHNNEIAESILDAVELSVADNRRVVRLKVLQTLPELLFPEENVQKETML